MSVSSPVLPGETEPYYDLGSYHRPIETPSPQAQVWFDRGMVWAYAFNHEEAIRCFDRASTVEQGLIEALQARFPTDDPNDPDALQAGHSAYADAMVALTEAYPDDIDVQTLAADALVNITAWALWDTRTGEPAPGSRVVEAKRILDDALATPAGRQHPGVLHLYLHTMEMSATPQDALPAADLLRNLVPDAGHLRHMPSHIDVLCGNYRDSVVSNLSAVQADRQFVERE
jgi:hypothetical protein